MKLFDWLTDQLLLLLYKINQPKSKPIEPATPQLVAKRFRQVFADHGIEVTQIPRVFPKITLDDLNADPALLKKLTPEVINKVAKLFNVRVEWLEGIDSVIYQFESCYKRPELFFEKLKNLKYGQWDFPFRVISTEKSLDYKDSGTQSFSLLFVEHIKTIGDLEVYRYALDVGWSYSHWLCRMQLKAMALLYWQHTRNPITFYTVPREIYTQIVDRQLIPHLHLSGHLVSSPSVEDYISEPKDSCVAKEYDELPDVYKYIDENQLNISIFNTNNGYQESYVDSEEISLQQKASKAKHEPVSQLKRDCVLFWLNNKKVSDIETARRFYHALPPERKKLLTETNAPITLSKAISEFKRKDELALTNKLPSWLADFNPDIA